MNMPSRNLRKMLNTGETLVMPGAYNAFVAKQMAQIAVFRESIFQGQAWQTARAYLTTEHSV